MILYAYSQKVIEQCESKISKLKEDLLNTKEALNRALLDKDVLAQERAEVSKYLWTCRNKLLST